MKNSFFQIDFDPSNGFIKSISHSDDKYKMNWCSETSTWGKIHSLNRLAFDDEFKNVMLDRFESSENYSTALYSNDVLSVKAERFFAQNGNFVERYTIKNITDTVVCINRDNFGIELPFNDRYTYADDCMVSRCNTHIWCGHNTVWINALKMGESDINLGLVLTSGAIDSYSQNDCFSNTRGVFVLNSSNAMLNPGAEYKIEWELFWHKGTDDFENILKQYPAVLQIRSDNFTVFNDEDIIFSICGSNFKNIKVTCNGDDIPFSIENDKIYVRYKPASTGDYRFKIYYNSNMYTYADFTVKPSFKTLVEKRINYIIDKQQCHEPSSPLYGAYLIYDNLCDYTYFDDSFPDHNACRERIGMPLLFAAYLQKNHNQKVKDSLDLYIKFLKREFYDSESGEVYNTIGKNRNKIRLYNAPWVMLLFSEMYYVTGDTDYLYDILKMADNYYSLGGKSFYPNGLGIFKIYNAFVDAGMDNEAKKIKEYFRIHIDNMISNGISYPKHEVNYEQTIVTPAATFISEFGLISDDKSYYCQNAYIHIKCLERFSGMQPSFHLNEIPIRYWDDYWFGKNKLHGDTFPHYWSCLTARSYIAFCKLSGCREYLTAAEKCLRNCLCLFPDDGSGSCAYVYPQSLNGTKGAFYDEWANDQDFALYFALSSSDCIDVFDIKD